MKHKTRIITDESQVPSGFVPLAGFRLGAGEQGAVARNISRWHKAGLIDAVKMMRTVDDQMGPVWVNAAHVDALLKAEDSTQEEDNASFNGWVRKDFAISAITVLSRIAVALDSIANTSAYMAHAQVELARQTVTDFQSKKL